ncbi:MAG TPA: hypothetical protein VHJ82_01990 [Actinomycetota bacterium]|nr:hypothetical protein [Actinomycetota bacterium]
MTDEAIAQEPEVEPEVDRSAVVRELAGLFSDEGGGGGGGSRTRRGPQEKHRVEDDEAVNRGLINRLIDGVKGL